MSRFVIDWWESRVYPFDGFPDRDLDREDWDGTSTFEADETLETLRSWIGTSSAAGYDSAQCLAALMAAHPGRIVEVVL